MTVAAAVTAVLHEKKLLHSLLSANFHVTSDNSDLLTSEWVLETKGDRNIDFNASMLSITANVWDSLL